MLLALSLSLSLSPFGVVRRENCGNVGKRTVMARKEPAAIIRIYETAAF